METPERPTATTPMTAPALPVPLTHPERILYPTEGITKQELAEYYLRVSDWILPYLRDRLLTLVRCPSGQDNPCFYQKHARQGLPESILSHDIGEDGGDRYVYIRDLAGLVALVQVGVLEIHPWNSKVDRLERPDQLVFDLDPDPDLPWARLVEGVLDVRNELKRVGLDSFVKTTGGKGLHVVVPIARRSSWEEAKAFSKAIAERLVQLHPDRYVATMSKKKRTGKIFVDYLRNARGATAVAPYSTRSRPGAPIATPVSWEELARDLRSEFFLRNSFERLAKLEQDPWEGFFSSRQGITKKAQRLLNLE